jgi:hypothetical protein
MAAYPSKARVCRERETEKMQKRSFEQKFEVLSIFGNDPKNGKNQPAFISLDRPWRRHSSMYSIPLFKTGIITLAFNSISSIMSEDQGGAEYESQHVHQVYEQIASHFSATRYKV